MSRGGGVSSSSTHKPPQVGTPLTRDDMKVRGKVEAVSRLVCDPGFSAYFVEVSTFKVGDKAESRSHTSPTRPSGAKRA